MLRTKEGPAVKRDRDEEANEENTESLIQLWVGYDVGHDSSSSTGLTVRLSVVKKRAAREQNDGDLTVAVRSFGK